MMVPDTAGAHNERHLHPHILDSEEGDPLDALANYPVVNEEPLR
jgi:hypothetical protein